ncbi:peptidoglycan-associated lipoprotein Pal [Vibrio renipiscarius]|uniref:Peptidoglycan-associated lipoprotein n=1 Tax=Vibrio renipiscarius TaxID=1461322 RepID=A0A0C2NSP0_9VIBR|nr:peptidoglycan-associated lipoprotein Pal [Vibrio renipiscarius]KII77047.1 lipoprotein [Vibrio renipiscarius]KII77177.1 lipoprotein [Vibrio renipiscarius]
MQLNKVLKGLFIALPILAVTACSSSDDAANASGTETNTGASTATTVVATPIDQSGQLAEQELKDQVMQASTIYFEFDNATIASDYEKVLALHAAYLSSNPALNVTVEGHADERGTPEYNIALGERRAQAVSMYLQALGVNADQIAIVSYGEEKPLVFGQSDEAYAKNRRAVLVY